MKAPTKKTKQQATAMKAPRTAMKATTKAAKATTKAAKATNAAKATTKAVPTLESEPPALQPDWAIEQAMALGDIQHPQWCDHYCDILAPLLQGLRQRCGQQMRVVLWIDFAGMTPEMEAAEEIRNKLKEKHELEVEFAIHVACDVNEASRRFIDQNYKPKYLSKDVADRCWDTGTFKTTLGELVELPRAGIDAYIGCFPCGPWSKRGLRLGLSDKDGHLYQNAIDTVAFIKPLSYVFENVCEIDGDHAVINQYAKEKLPDFSSITVTGVEPLHTGYAVKKRRMLQLGTNNGACVTDGLSSAMGSILQSPMPLARNYRQFLDLPQHNINWSRFNQYPTTDELDFLAGAGSVQCTCSLDPMVVCMLHPCRCKVCDPLNPLGCVWRTKAMTYIEAHFSSTAEFLTDVGTRKLTYCNVLDLYSPFAIKSPRVRNMMNILAHLPRCQPLHATTALLDASQAIDRVYISVDGTTPTAATNTQFVAMCDGKVIPH